MQGGQIDRQLDVMNLLWERGAATLPQIRDGLADAAPPGEVRATPPGAVRTVLRTLERDGRVLRASDGGADRYHPTLGRRETGREALRRVAAGYFGGSVRRLLRAVAEAASRGREEAPGTEGSGRG